VQRTLLLLLIAASYTLAAGAPPGSLAILLAIAISGVLVAPHATLALPASTRAVDYALIMLMGAMVLQMVPLPSAIVDAISPRAVEVARTLHLAPPGAGRPAWSTFSIDPVATRLAIGTAALGLLSFWIARTVFSAGGSTRLFCRALTFLATLAAGLAVIQKAVAPRLVLFMIEPDARSANPFGAFVNRNHFAAWMLLAAGPAAGYLIARLHAHPSHRGVRESIGHVMSSGIVLTSVALMVIIGTLLLTLSRSAVAGLAAAAVAGWWLARPRLHLERTSAPALLAALGAVLLIVLLFVDLDGWASRLSQSFNTTGIAFSRISIWRESLAIVRDFWATGTGAGTYSDAMTLYQQTRLWVGSMQRWAHFNTAHSHYLQALCEGGVLLAIPAMWAAGAVAVLGRRAIRADKGEMFWVRTGAFASLAGLAVQSVWEVALIMPANAVLAGAVAGLLLHHREAGRTA
jgi:O-antigen ligase